MFKKNLDKNIQAILKVNPLLGAKLLKITTNTKYEVFQGKDPIDINIYDNDLKVSLYESPAKNTEEMLVSLLKKYSKYPILYFYGVGNGILLNTLLQSNEKLKRLVIVEPELELLYIAMNFNDFSKSILCKEIIFIYSKILDSSYSMELMKVKEYEAYFKLYELRVVSDYYLDYYGEDMVSVNSKFTDAIMHAVTSHGNSSIDNLMGLEHHIQNIPKMVNSITIRDIMSQKNSEVAVIVSLGPSLDKQLELLKEYQDYITIIAPEASLNVCAQNGIQPDIIVSLERTEIIAEIIQKTPKEAVKNTNFFVVSFMHEKSIKEFEKGKLAIIQRPFGYCMHFKELVDWGYVGIGMSASNLAVELAYIIKCSHIAVIGQDLAYGEKGESHSDGNVFGENQIKTNETDSETVAYGGKGKVRTSVSWNIFREYFETYAADVKKFRNMDFVNATEGGARISGALEMPFAEFLSKNVDKSKKKTKIDFSNFQKKKNTLGILKQSQRRLNHMVKYGQIIQTKFEETFLMISKVSDKIIELNDNKKTDEIDFDRLQEVVDEINRVKLICNKKLFYDIFYDILQTVLQNEERELALLTVANDEGKEAKQIVLVNWVMDHRRWFFIIAGNIDAQIEIVSRSRIALDEEIKKLEK
jgi:hypothetical protein